MNVAAKVTAGQLVAFEADAPDKVARISEDVETITGLKLDGSFTKRARPKAKDHRRLTDKLQMRTVPS